MLCEPARMRQYCSIQLRSVKVRKFSIILIYFIFNNFNSHNITFASERLLLENTSNLTKDFFSKMSCYFQTKWFILFSSKRGRSEEKVFLTAQQKVSDQGSVKKVNLGMEVLLLGVTIYRRSLWSLYLEKYVLSHILFFLRRS